MNRRTMTSSIAAAAIVLGAAMTANAQTQTDYTATSHSIVSGAVGGAFGADAADGSFGFDGAYDYLHNGRFGFEFLGSFTPDFHATELNTIQETRVNSYMFNAIGAMPLGMDDRWMPYASGGVGVLTLRSELDLDDESFDADGLPLVDDNQFGMNIGVGVMGFMDQIGMRADVRYFTGVGNAGDVDEPSGTTLNSAIGDVNFWRATAGISYRW